MDVIITFKQKNSNFLKNKNPLNCFHLSLRNREVNTGSFQVETQGALLLFSRETRSL